MALAEERYQRHRDAILLEGRVDLALEEFARLGLERAAALVGPELLGFPQPPMAIIELLDEPGEPARAGLRHDHPELRVAFEDAPGEQIDKRLEEIAHKEFGVLEDARGLALGAVAHSAEEYGNVPGEDDPGIFEQ